MRARAAAWTACSSSTGLPPHRGRPARPLSTARERRPTLDLRNHETRGAGVVVSSRRSSGRACTRSVILGGRTRGSGCCSCTNSDTLSLLPQASSVALLVPCDALACVGCLKNRISELAISAVPLTFETFDPPAAAVYVRLLASRGLERYFTSKLVVVLLLTYFEYPGGEREYEYLVSEI